MTKTRRGGDRNTNQPRGFFERVSKPETLALLAALRAKVMVSWLCTQGRPRGLGQPWAEFLNTVGVVNMPRCGARAHAFNRNDAIEKRGAHASGVWFAASRRKLRLTIFPNETMGLDGGYEPMARRPRLHAGRVRSPKSNCIVPA